MKLLVLWSFFLTLPVMAQDQQDHFILELTNFEAYRIEAMNLVHKHPLRDLDIAYTLHFKKMVRMVLTQEDKVATRYGLTVTLKTMKQLGRHEKAQEVASSLLPRFFDGCDSFSSCLAMMKDLSDLIESVPQQLDCVFDNLEASVDQVTLHLTHESKTPFTNSLVQRILRYRLDSLKAIWQFYLLSNVGNPYALGKRPHILSSDLKRFLELLPRLNQQYQSLKNIDHLDDLLHADLVDFEGVVNEQLLSFMVSEMIQALELTHWSNQSLSIYLERLNHPADEWLNQMFVQVRQNQLDVNVLFLTLVRFADFEFYLPWRDNWMASLKLASSYPTFLMHDMAEQLVPYLENLKEIRDGQLMEFLKAQGFNDNLAYSRSPVSIGELLSYYEQQLAKTYPQFHSLYFQLGGLTSAQNHLAAMANLFDHFNQGEFKEELKESTGINLEAAHDNALTKWIALGCWARLAVPTQHSSERDKVEDDRLTIFFSQDNQKRLENFCPSSSWMNQGENRIPSQYVANKLLPERISAAWKPFYYEAAITGAMIPLTVLSGGIAGAFSNGAARGAAALGVRAALRAGVSRMAGQVLVQVVPKLVGAISGAAMFTLIQRPLMTAISFGQVPLYDPSKNFIQNYGKDLLMGSSIFFFLPYSAGIGQRLMQRFSGTSLLASRPLLRQLGALSVVTTVDTTVFTSIPYIERLIQKHFFDSNDPVLRGANDFLENLGHSAMIALAFRMKEASHY